MQASVSSGIPRCVLLSGFVFAGSLSAQLTPSVPNAPDPLRPPKDQLLLLHLEGKGTQIYTCQNRGGVHAWKLKRPDANLFRDSGEETGCHFAGPTWETKDGSRVTGKFVASVPSPDSLSIPWLLLSTSRGGTGVMSRVESIQRLNTKGGKAPDAGCDAAHENAETSVPYEASYYFYGTKP